MVDRIVSIACLVLSVFISVAAFHHWSARKNAEAERDKVSADWADYRAEVQRLAAESERTARERIQAITQAAAKANTHAANQIKALATERDEARSVAVRLYQLTQELAARANSCERSNGLNSVNAGPGTVLADMHRRTDEAAAVFADYADRLRIEIEALRATQDAMSK